MLNNSFLYLLWMRGKTQTRMIIVRFMVVSVFSTRIPPHFHYAPYIAVQMAGQDSPLVPQVTTVLFIQ